MEQQDWQKGCKSTTSTNERIIAHEEWLKKIHKEIKEKIESKKENNYILSNEELEKEKM